MSLKIILLSIAILFLSICAAYAEIKVQIVYAEPLEITESVQKKKLQQSLAVQSVVNFIDSYFSLSEQLVFFFGGEDGPFYEGQTNRIVIPYSFLEEVEFRFTNARYEETGVSIVKATEDALMHTLFHEFAHAAIYMYELPVLGKEEDAADALASILLIEFFEEGHEIVLSAADLFDIESDDRNILEDEDFWDEHSLDDQRYFSALCHVYGSAPEEYAAILKEGRLSEERADLCVEEYETISQSWLELLKPHTKDDQTNVPGS